MSRIFTSNVAPHSVIGSFEAVCSTKFGLLQEVDEKRQLTKRRDGFVRRPASMNLAPKTFQRHRPFLNPFVPLNLAHQLGESF